MGRISSNSQPEQATIIHHFSHDHPLHLTNPQQTRNQSSCSGCKHKANSGLIYSCTTCNYFLHIKCSQMPKEITHPCDKNHVFSLLSIPTYPDGTFNCDACKKQGDGFSYHCKECKVDLHILCAVLPMSRTHHSHPHELKLAFGSPYASKIFHCDVCENLGSDHWLYRCHFCEHDVHLDCVNNQSRSAPQPQGPQPFVPQSMNPCLPTFTPVMNNHFNQGIQGPFTPIGVAQNYDMMYQQALQSIMGANTAQPRFGQQDILQAILSNGANGIGNGMGNAGMQNLLQAFTGGNDIMGGGGGGGVDILQGLVGGGGGGGGGVDILQGLLGGGGGGGIGIPGLDGLGGVDGLLGGLGGLGLF